jgi:hypothetical protein
MSIELPIIKRSSINGLLLKVRSHERELAEKELSEKHGRDLQNMKGIYELKILEMKSEIEMLGRVIDKQNKTLQESQDREIMSKEIYLKAQHIASQVDYEFRKHTENSARSMAQFRQIRLDAEEFSKKMIEGK